MNGVPPMDRRPEDIDEYYRRASALDSDGPSETVRRRILAHAAELAAARGAHEARAPIDRSRSALRRASRPALLGSLMAAIFAGLLITPHLLNPPLSPAGKNAAPASAAPTPSTLTPSPPSGPTAAISPRLESEAASRAEQSTLRQENQFIAGARYPHLAAQTASPAAAAPSASAIAAGDQGPALRRAAQAGDIATVRLLLDRHVHTESRDARGRTALMLATLNGRTETVSELLAGGADPGAADAQGITPLRAAEARNYRDIVALLKSAPAR